MVAQYAREDKLSMSSHVNPAKNGAPLQGTARSFPPLRHYEASPVDNPLSLLVLRHCQPPTKRRPAARPPGKLSRPAKSMRNLSSRSPSLNWCRSASRRQPWMRIRFRSKWVTLDRLQKGRSDQIGTAFLLPVGRVRPARVDRKAATRVKCHLASGTTQYQKLIKGELSHG